MKTQCLAALLLAITFAAPTPASAGSATWNLNPTSNDWNTAANWTPATVPNGPGDTATFDVSNTTGVSLSANIEVNGLIYSSGASAFSLTIANQSTFTLSGVGSQNNSTALQNIDVPDGTVNFTNNAAAGNAAYTIHAISRMSGGGTMQFFNDSSADHGSFTTEGQLLVGFPSAAIYFNDQSTAGEGSFLNGGSNAHEEFGSGGMTEFLDHATAGNARFDNNAGNVFNGEGGSVFFFDRSSAGTATIINRGARISNASGGLAEFGGGTTAAQSKIINEPSGGSGFAGETIFAGGRAGDATILMKGAQSESAFAGTALFDLGGTADNATLILTGGKNGGPGGSLFFALQANGGASRIVMSGNSLLAIYGISASTLTIGSLEGEGTVYLGQKMLAVGANNLDTTFASLLRDGDPFGGAGPGFLEKTGTGTFRLTGANTYTGGTSVDAGKLVVANTTGSATGTGPVQVNAGILGGKGIIAGAVTLGTGSGAGASLQPSVRASQPVKITIESSVTFNADSTYIYKLGTRKAQADQVVANGVTIENGAQFNFTALGNKRLAAGTVFIAISNTSTTTISGIFANLADGSTLTVGRNKLLVSYSGGDGNDLTLTVVP
jgi:autotransporter-associated beta strand protein